jgi:hypothetical protein
MNNNNYKEIIYLKHKLMDKKCCVIIILFKLKIRMEIPKITVLKRSTIHFKSFTFKLYKFQK